MPSFNARPQKRRGGNDVRSQSSHLWHSDRTWRNVCDATFCGTLSVTTMSGKGIRHKRDQVQAFDKNVQQLDPLTEKQFLECLGVRDNLIRSEFPHSPQNLSIDGFCSLANGIAQSIKETREHHLLCIYLFLTTHDFAVKFPDDHLLVFEDTGNKTPKGHVTGTKCRPDITAASVKEWKMCSSRGVSLDWEIIRLAGERASQGKQPEEQKKHAATYLHYLLLARPDLLVAQGLLTTKSEIMFLVGIGGVGIRQFTVNWHDQRLNKFLYAFIYRLYDPSHFADPSYTRTGFDKETSQATYTLRLKGEPCPDFRSIHARNPFGTRTHVLSNPKHTKARVIKDSLCLTRRFDEQTILFKIHETRKVPGVVEVVDSEIIPAYQFPGRVKHRLGLRQTGSPFTSIRTAKKVLETLFDLLEGI